MQIADQFRERYGVDAQVWWAPGRVNLIGEHIDYCGGRVLPMPIQFGTTVAIATTHEPVVDAVSINTDQVVHYAHGQPAQYPAGHWGRYVLGAVDTLAEHLGDRGLYIMVAGDIPGSGLSSSASLTVALLAGIGGALGVSWQALDLAQAAQRIEHDYVGVSCGLMDQAVLAGGVAGAAFLFDCAANIGHPVRFPTPSPDLLVVDSGKRRALVHSAYNERLAETQRAAQMLGVPRSELAPAAAACSNPPKMDITALRRLRHVGSEQLRVGAAVTAIAVGNWAGLGELFDASHTSLRDDFEVSCHELDTLVRLLRGQPSCLGARMTGAGFGGSVVALVAEEGTSILDAVAQPYARATGLRPRAFVARSSGGVRQLHG